jgi:homopolymeric O-antigen transport system ATP-binding protein
MRRARIAVCGTFDVENFGDLLFPIVAQRELVARLGDVDLVPYSYHARDAPMWPYPVRSLELLADDIGDFDLVIVGGGHLIRFDKEVANEYAPPVEWIHHPTGYWLMPTLLAAGAGVPVAWNALQVSRGTPSWAADLISSALDATAYASVRDKASLRELSGYCREDAVVLIPDTVFGIEPLVPSNPSEEFGRLLGNAGISESYVIVQACRKLAPFSMQIDVALADVIAAGHRTLELPISPCLGDDVGVVGLSTATERLSEWPHPLLLAELVARSEAVIAQSLHLSIVALAFGVPVHRIEARGEGKYRLLEEFETVAWWSGEAPARFRDAIGRHEREKAVSRQIDRSQANWDVIAGLVGAKSATGRRAMAELFGRVTATLEASGEAPGGDDRGGFLRRLSSRTRAR